MSANQTLTKLGFNEKEIKVYLALLRHGKNKPSALAKLTKLNRATLYHTAKELVSKGVIAEDLSGKFLHFVVLDINSLDKMLEQEKRELKEKEPLVTQVIGELQNIASEKSYPVPKIRFIEYHIFFGSCPQAAPSEPAIRPRSLSRSWSASSKPRPTPVTSC